MTQLKIARWGAFYKYGTFARIDRIRAMLCEKEFYFPPPNQLNDPCDCRNRVKRHSSAEIEEFLVEANRLFYGDARDDAYIKRGIAEFGVEVLLDEITRSLNETLSSRYGVLSLTKRPDNFALWAKYADNHAGFCIEFSDLTRFFPVYEVIYSDKLPFDLCADLNQAQVDFLFTKSPEWSNEEEARILTNRPGITLFPANCITAIILGERCGIKHQTEVVKAIKECGSTISVKKVKFNPLTQRLDISTVAV